MHVEIKRVYEDSSPDDGTRVLVDRLWPRGKSKEAAHIDEWAKDIAPSTELRQWFDHNPKRFEEFASSYRAELHENKDAIDEILERIDLRKRVTLVYAAKDTQCNHAVVLKSFLEQLNSRSDSA